MKDTILKQLRAECPFPKVFEDLERGENRFSDVPRRKIGHIRADHDGYRWRNTVWPCHPALASKEISAEIDRIYDALTAVDALKDLPALTRFCEAHSEACVDRQFQQEYSFFLEGESCDFWVRLITRERDYNLYLYAFAKEKDSCGS